MTTTLPDHETQVPENTPPTEVSKEATNASVEPYVPSTRTLVTDALELNEAKAANQQRARLEHALAVFGSLGNAISDPAERHELRWARRSLGPELNGISNIMSMLGNLSEASARFIRDLFENALELQPLSEEELAEIALRVSNVRNEINQMLQKFAIAV